MGGHLWYLGAILYVLIIVYLADKFHFQKLLNILIPVFIICDLLFGKYSLLIWGKEFPVYYVRNFLFVGLPYFCIGRMVHSECGSRIKSRSLVAMTVVFSVTTLLERYILIIVGMNATRDHYISTTFLAVSVFLLSTRIDTKEGALSVIGCKYSTWLYILHPIFITVFTVVTRRVGLYNYYSYIAPFVVYAATLVFLIMGDFIKNKFIKPIHGNPCL